MQYISANCYWISWNRGEWSQVEQDNLKVEQQQQKLVIATMKNELLKSEKPIIRSNFEQLLQWLLQRVLEHPEKWMARCLIWSEMQNMIRNPTLQFETISFWLSIRQTNRQHLKVLLFLIEILIAIVNPRNYNWIEYVNFVWTGWNVAMQFAKSSAQSLKLLIIDFDSLTFQSNKNGTKNCCILWPSLWLWFERANSSFHFGVPFSRWFSLQYSNLRFWWQTFPSNFSCL
jgi:hypothetical protein